MTTPTKPAAKTPAKRKSAPKPTVQKPERPYILDSAVVRDEIERQRQNALSEIDAIQADKLSITQRAERDIASIRERAEAEIRARDDRERDLQKIIDMTGRALGEDEAPIRGAEEGFDAVKQKLEAV